MKISGIIFDKDGTLLDFNEFWIPAAQCVIRRILSYYKIPVTDIHTEKALKHTRLIGRRDADPGIADGKNHTVVLFFSSNQNLHVPIGDIVSNGIVT